MTAPARWIVALVLVSSAALPPSVARSAERSLTLDEAVRLALRKNEDLVSERASVAAARASLNAARGAYDPLLTVDGGWQRSTEPVNSSFSGAPSGSVAPKLEASDANASLRQLLPTGGAVTLRASGGKESTNGSLTPLSPAYDTQVGVELRQPLLRERSTDRARLSVRVAAAGRDGAAASLRRSTSETVAAVDQAYWGLVAARLAVQVREEAVRLAEEQLKQTRDRTESGVVPRTELAQPEAELERRRGELLASREAAARAENRLKLLILDGADDPLWSESLAPVQDTSVDVVPSDVPTAMTRALAGRPELAIAEAALKQRRAETAFARDGVLPSLDAVVSYDRYGLAGSKNSAATTASVPSKLVGDLGDSFGAIGDGDFYATRVAVELGLPIRNRTARGNAAVARHVQEQAEADLKRVRKAIRAEVLDAAAALETAGQRIEAARAGRAAAEVQLSAERDRYGTGLSTNFLVLTRQNDLSRARLDEISALTDYRTARTEMARAAGTLLEERGIHIDDPGH